MIDLFTSAELKAEKANQLPNFRNFSLRGVKDKVAQILRMIGTVEGVFQTYTLHDISHIDSMLSIVEWIIPEPTKNKMTRGDWLLIVLSIYFHDMGMVITSKEFEKRNKNPKFKEFMDWINNDIKGKDYLVRVSKLKGKAKDSFFYQEFVRHYHAERVKNWIMGNSSHYWGDALKPVIDEIQSILSGLPKRFKDDLAIVCESHHKNDLNKIDKYPLFQSYGTNEDESANVQYAAVILRTVDLLHVTNNRTPSIMYKALEISDPIGIDEWKKQLGTFSVKKVSRELDLNDEETHQIKISANFSEERPFFALTEYITYANKEIEQSKNWIEESQKTVDGKNYLFPWHTVKGDIRVEGNLPVPVKFELDRGKLLDLLVGHTLYNDPTVVIRELLQNSIDAVRFKHFLNTKDADDPSSIKMGKVEVFWDEEERTLTVKDNGIGMDKSVIQNNLMKVGSSFYNSDKFQAENKDFSPISRFGIGVLTCFMVSDDIEIITCKGNSGHRIRMSSVHADYLLKELPIGNQALNDIEPHGTKVTLRLRPSVDLKNKTILDILKFWIILPPCQVIFSNKKVKNEKIGFDTVEEVLQHFYINKLESSKSIYFDENIYIKTLSKQIENEQYQFAFAVKESWSPEKNFIYRSEADAPGICIEGIRVGDTIPGYEKRGFSNLCAFLSVKGNKKFRTTVSRDQLEKDEEYINVSKICTDFLIEHIKDEIKRISCKKGQPLSQASTASKWLTEKLVRRVSGNNERKYLEERLYELNSIVIEELSKSNSYSRKLISNFELLNLPFIWTINSRLEKHLGFISRDLGRELSINQFFETIAPDLINKNITPILIDYQNYLKRLIEEYSPEVVLFSKQKQETKIKWKKGIVKSQLIFKELYSTLSKTENRSQIYNLFENFEIPKFVDNYLNNYYRYQVGKIRYIVSSDDIKKNSGDNLIGIISENLILIDKKSSLYKFWEKACDCYYFVNSNGSQEQKFWANSWLLVLFFKFNHVDKSSSLFRYNNVPKGIELLHIWEKINLEFSKVIEDDKFLNVSIEDFFGTEKNWYIPSKYWINWG